MAPSLSTVTGSACRLSKNSQPTIRPACRLPSDNALLVAARMRRKSGRARAEKHQPGRDAGLRQLIPQVVWMKMSRDSNGAELAKRGSRLFDAAAGWRSLNQELAENYFPMSADFTGSLNLGDDYALDLMDSYPVQARQQLGDAIEAMLRQGSWFQVSSGDPELDKVPAVARALQRMSQIVSAIIRSPGRMPRSR